MEFVVAVAGVVFASVASAIPLPGAMAQAAPAESRTRGALRVDDPRARSSGCRR